MREVGSDAGRVDDIVQGKLVDELAVLKQQGQRLADAGDISKQ